ncbi:unnamed protein product [Amoebophrya sp. A120]|nr:unnamed protein product [Amoebophrya sp. A120]|eukprot:GSA120T00023734001.1
MSAMMRPHIISSLLLVGVVDAVQQSVAIENDAEMYSAEPSSLDPFVEGGAVKAEKERTPAAAAGKTSPPSAFSQTSAMARLQKLFTSAKSRVNQVKEAQKIASASQQHFKTLVLDLALNYDVKPMTVLNAARFSSLDTDGNDVLEGAELCTCPLSADLNEDKKLDFPEYNLHCSSQQEQAGDGDGVSKIGGVNLPAGPGTAAPEKNPTEMAFLQMSSSCWPWWLSSCCDGASAFQEPEMLIARSRRGRSNAPSQPTSDVPSAADAPPAWRGPSAAASQSQGATGIPFQEEESIAAKRARLLRDGS